MGLTNHRQGEKTQLHKNNVRWSLLTSLKPFLIVSVLTIQLILICKTVDHDKLNDHKLLQELRELLRDFYYTKPPLMNLALI